MAALKEGRCEKATSINDDKVSFIRAIRGFLNIGSFHYF